MCSAKENVDGFLLLMGREYFCLNKQCTSKEDGTGGRDELNGFAYTKAICQVFQDYHRGAAFAIDNGAFGGLGNVVHELGDLVLGYKYHDKQHGRQGSNCPSDKGLLLSGTFARYEHHRRKNLWSQCSRIDFNTFVKSEYAPTCLFNRPPETKYPLFDLHEDKMRPPQIPPLEEQCGAARLDYTAGINGGRDGKRRPVPIHLI